MKKINLIIVMLLSLLSTGCGNVNLDLDKVSKKLDELNTNSFDLLAAVENIEMDETYFENLVSAYDYDLEEMGINKDIVENMAFRLDSENKPAYIIIKPVDGKNKELEKQIENYLEKFDDLKELKSEYEGYLIYIFSKDAEEIIEIIKNSKSKVFGMLIDVGKEDLETLTGVKSNDVEEFLVKNSVMTQASSYYILKPAKGKKEKVKETMDNYMETLEEQWKTYLPEQYELVKNRLEEEYGDYLIYVISSNNELVFNAIKDCKD